MALVSPLGEGGERKKRKKHLWEKREILEGKTRVELSDHNSSV